MEKPTVIHTRDDKLNNPYNKVKVNGAEMSVGDLYKELDRTSPFNQEKNILIFWDDVLMLTGLGLYVYYLNKEYIHKVADFIGYNDRPNHLIYPRDYFIDKIKTELIDVTKGNILEVFKENYTEVLRYSPKHKLLTTLLSLDAICDKIAIVFPFDFVGCKEILEDIRSRTKHPIKGYFSNFDNEEKFLDKRKELLDEYNMFVCRDGGMIYSRCLKTNKMNKAVICPSTKNGFSKDYLALYEAMDAGEIDVKLRPNNIEILFYKENNI